MARITLRQFVVVSCVAIAIPLLLSAGVYFLRDMTDLGTKERIAAVFDVGEEASLPTLISTTQLLLGALLALFVQRRAVQYRRSWAALSWLLLYLAIDEACQLHEQAFPALFPTFQGKDEEMMIFWAPFGLAAAVLVGAAFIPFLLRIQRRTAVFFVIGGAVFLCGALGFEVLGKWMIHVGFERTDLIYNLRRLAEEGLELGGVLIVNVALFRELAGRAGVVGIELTRPDS